LEKELFYCLELRSPRFSAAAIGGFCLTCCAWHTFSFLLAIIIFKPPHIAMNCKPKARRKTAWLNFRATSAEALLLTQAAEMTGIQRSTLLRRAALKAATEALEACQ